MSKVKIITECIRPPIPDRSHDWRAYYHWDDEADAMLGEGETEEAAVLDLFKKSAEADDDGSAIEEVINFAIIGWQVPL